MLDFLQVDLSLVLKSERIELTCMRSRRDRAERQSLEVDLFRLNGFESYKFTREKMIDIGSVGSGVKYHSLSYWSIVMTSPVEFSTDEFRVKQV